MFFGPRIAKSYIISHLIRDLPTRTALYENYLGLPSGYFVEPKKWYTFDPERRDYNPVVFVYTDNSDKFERISYDGYGSPYFLSHYPTTVVLWVADKSRREVTDYRDAYSAVIRDSLVRLPSLRPPNTNLECHVRIEENTLFESFSDVFKESNQNYWAAAGLEFNTIVEETLDYPIQGVFKEAEITIAHMSLAPTPPQSVRASCEGTSCSVTWDSPAWSGGFYEIDSYEVQYTPVTHHDDDITVPFVTDSYEDVQGSDFDFQAETHSWTSAGAPLSAADYDNSITSTKSFGSMIIGGHTSLLTTHTEYFTVSGLVSGTTYRFRVRAVNSAGESGWAYSDPVTLE